MKCIKILTGFLFGASLLIATSTFAQDNQVRPKTDRPTTGGTTTPAAGGNVSTTRPNANGPSQNTGKPASGSKTYTTKSNYTTMLVSNAKEGDMVKYRVEAGGKTAKEEMVKVEAGQTTASASICRDNARGLKVTYSSSNASARVAFKDSPSCSGGKAADGSATSSSSEDRKAKGSAAKKASK